MYLASRRIADYSTLSQLSPLLTFLVTLALLTWSGSFTGAVKKLGWSASHPRGARYHDFTTRLFPCTSHLTRLELNSTTTSRSLENPSGLEGLRKIQATEIPACSLSVIWAIDVHDRHSTLIPLTLRHFHLFFLVLTRAPLRGMQPYDDSFTCPADTCTWRSPRNRFKDNMIDGKIQHRAKTIRKESEEDKN